VPVLPDRKTARRVAETLALATGGGVAFALAGMPAGFLSGSIVAVATAALAGRPLMVPRFLTRTIFVIIGISLGSVVTPETLHGVVDYPASIAALMVALIVISLGGTAYLCVVHGWKPLSAYLACTPGGMSQVLVMAAELGADLRGVAIVQSLRVMVIAIGLPAGLTVLGLGGHAARRGNGPLTLAVVDDLAILVVLSTLGALIADRIRFPGGLLFGALFASAALHGTALVEAVVPPWVANAAMVALGGVVGARFANMPLRILLSYLGASLGSLALSMVVAVLFAAGAIVMLGLPPAEVALAYAPGSVDAMMLLALALHLDPVYVGAHHVTRVIFVSAVLPLIARNVMRRAKRLPAAMSEPAREQPRFQD
jgi:membrane AbrB-like protein